MPESLATMAQAEQTPPAQQASEPSVENQQDSSMPDTDSPPLEWSWAEGIKGEGVVPDGFDSKKYKFVVDQVKAYPEARKELDAKLKEIKKLQENAPLPENEEYVLDKNLDIDPENSTIKEFLDLAKTKKLSNEAVNDLFKYHQSLISKAKKTDDENYTRWQQDQYKQIGENPKQQFKELETWFVNNFGREGLEAFQTNIQRKADFDLWQKVRNTNLKIPTSHTSDETPRSMANLDAQLQKYMADPRYLNNDPEYIRNLDNWIRANYRGGISPEEAAEF